MCRSSSGLPGKSVAKSGHRGRCSKPCKAHCKGRTHFDTTLGPSETCCIWTAFLRHKGHNQSTRSQGQKQYVSAWREQYLSVEAWRRKAHVHLATYGACREAKVFLGFEEEKEGQITWWYPTCPRTAGMAFDLLCPKSEVLFEKECRQLLYSEPLSTA